MGAEYPPNGQDPFTAPKLNPSPSQSLWQSELIASATSRRNMESVRLIFNKSYASVIPALRTRFGDPITTGVMQETGLRKNDSVGSPRFRKALLLFSKKTNIPPEKASGILESIVTLYAEEQKVREADARMLRHNFKSLFSGDIPIAGQFEALTAVTKHPLDLGASSDSPSAWVRNTSLTEIVPRAIAWDQRYGLRNKEWHSPYMQYLERNPPLQPDQDKTELLRNYKGGKYWREFGVFSKAKPSEKTLDYDLFKSKLGVAALDHNLYLLTGSVPDAQAGRIIPSTPVRINLIDIAKPQIHEGVFLHPMLMFYAKAYGRNQPIINYWKTAASYRLQALKEGAFGVCYLVPVNPITGGALAPGIPVSRIRGTPTDAMLFTRKYYPHVMSMEEGDNPSLHPELLKVYGAVGSTRFQQDWQTAPEDFKTSQRFAVVLRSTWAWPDTTLARDKNWEIFSPNVISGSLNSEQLNMLQVSRLNAITSESEVPGKEPKRNSGVARSLLDGKPAPVNAHKTDIAEVYIIDSSAEVFLRNAVQTIQDHMYKAAKQFEQLSSDQKKFKIKDFNHQRNVALCAFGMINSALWIRKGSLTDEMKIPNVESAYGVYGGFSEQVAGDAHRLLSPIMSGIQSRLAMSVPINEKDDIGLVMTQFGQQYGRMPELIVPDMTGFSIVNKKGGEWNPRSHGATLIREQGPTRLSKLFNMDMKAIRPFHPYHVYQKGLKIPGDQGNLKQFDEVWTTTVMKRYPIQVSGLSGKQYGENAPMSSSMRFEPIENLGFAGLFGKSNTSEGFETNNGMGVVMAGAMATVAGMLALRGGRYNE